MVSLGLTQLAQTDEKRDRAASSPTIPLPSNRSPEHDRDDYENVKNRESPPKPQRSNSLPQHRLVKKWPSVRFTRKSEKEGEAPTNNVEKSRNKVKILQGSTTPVNILKNMHDINYELTGKGQFHSPSQGKKGNKSDKDKDSDKRPLVASSGDETVSPDEPPNTSGVNGAPVYFTVQQPNGDFSSDPDVDECEDTGKRDVSENGGSGVYLPVVTAHVENPPFFSRSMTMSDTYEKKRKKPSFKIVSSGKSKRSSKRKVVSSATWNARELERNKAILQQERESQAKFDNRSSDVYEDIENDAVGTHTKVKSCSNVTETDADAAVRSVEVPGMYSRLSRSLEDGLAGLGDKEKLPGYQSLHVNSGGNYEGVMV